MKKQTLCALICAITTSFALLTPAQAGTEYEYQFNPSSSGTGFGGDLLFKEPINAAGGLSDIDFQNSTLITPDGNFNLGTSYDFIFASFTSGLTQTGSLAWNGSTITSMNISGNNTGYFLFFPLNSENFTLTQGGISESSSGFTFFDGYFPPDSASTTGTWDYVGTNNVSSVPDHVNTAALLGMALAGLAFYRLPQKRAQRA